MGPVGRPPRLGVHTTGPLGGEGTASPFVGYVYPLVRGLRSTAHRRRATRTGGGANKALRPAELDVRERGRSPSSSMGMDHLGVGDGPGGLGGHGQGILADSPGLQRSPALAAPNDDRSVPVAVDTQVLSFHGCTPLLEGSVWETRECCHAAVCVEGGPTPRCAYGRSDHVTAPRAGARTTFPRPSRESRCTPSHIDQHGAPLRHRVLSYWATRSSDAIRSDRSATTACCRSGA